MSVALLFPGQGAQTPGFLHALPAHPAVRDTLAESSAVLGRDALELDSAAELRSSSSTQLSLFIAGASFARFLFAEGVAVQAAAGMSVGAFAAAFAAGSLLLPDALQAVSLRGKLMTSTLPPDYRMAVVDGLPEPQLQALLAAWTEISIANHNSPLQFVLAGPGERLAAILPVASEAGAHTARLLNMPTASHTPLLAPAAAELLRAMRTMPMHPPAFPVFSNRTARPLHSADALRQDLAENMAHPVRWHDVVTALVGYDPGLLLEAPPGHTLTHLATSFFPGLRVLAAAETSWPRLVREAQRSS